MPAATLAVRVSAQIAEFQKSFKELTKTTESFHDDFKKLAANVEKSSGFSGLVQQAGTVAAGMLTAATAIGAVTAAFTLVSSAASTAFNALKSIAGGVVDAVKSTIALGDTLFTLSQQTGISVESLSALKFVAGQTGTTLDALSGAVFKMEANLGAGTKKTADAVAGLGLSLSELRKSNPADAFATIFDRLNDIPNASQRAAAGVAIFGKGFKDIAQLAREDLGALLKKAQELGVVMSTETAVAADRFNDALAQISASAEGLKLKIGSAVLPGLIAFTESFQTAFGEAVKAAGLSSESIARIIDQLVVSTAKGAGTIIQGIALIVQGFAALASGKFLEGAAVFRLLTELQTQTLLAGRLIDTVFAKGALKGALDGFESLIRKQIVFVTQTAVAAETANAGLQRLAQVAAETASRAGESFESTYARIKSELARSAATMRRDLGQVGHVAEDVADDVAKAFDKVNDALNGTKLVQTAKAWESALKAPGAAAKLLADRALSQELVGALKAVSDHFGSLERAGVASLEGILVAAKAVTAQAKTVLPDLVKEISSPQALAGLFALNGPQMALPFAIEIDPFDLRVFSDELEQQARATAARIEEPFHDVFKSFGDKLPDLIFDTLKNGGSIVGAIASGLAAELAAATRKALEIIQEEGGSLTGKQKALALAGTGLSSFISGFGIGQGTGSKTKGALGGAASGALAGLPLAGVTGGLSVAVGAAAGFFGGLFGGRSAQKKMREELEANKRALLEQFGGMTKLRALADKLGVNIQAAFDAKKPEQFQAAVDKLNSAIERQQKAIEGLGKAVDGVNARAQNFARQFADLITKRDDLLGGRSASELSGSDAEKLAGISAKLAEVAQRTQPEFERLGVMVRDTFAGLIKETGNAFEAIVQLAPAFQVLQDGVNNFGLTSTAVIDELLKSFNLVNDEVFGPLLQNVQQSGQVLMGLLDANALSPEGFQAIAADIGQSLQEVANRGGDISRALALSQPVLQALWEAQQRFGTITDQTTQDILRQAEQQGLVGEHMKDVNEKILDVLIAIADVFGADIPDALRGLPQAAQEAAKGVEDAFTNVKIPPINVPVEVDPAFNMDRFRDFVFPDVLPFAKGGIVTRPTLALIGEAGPEAVVPLSGPGLALRQTGAAATVVHQHEYHIHAWDGQDVDRVFRTQILPRQKEAIRRDTDGIRTEMERV
jgi:hypothetical protein